MSMLHTIHSIAKINKGSGMIGCFSIALVTRCSSFSLCYFKILPIDEVLLHLSPLFITVLCLGPVAIMQTNVYIKHGLYEVFSRKVSGFCLPTSPNCVYCRM